MFGKGREKSLFLSREEEEGDEAKDMYLLKQKGRRCLSYRRKRKRVGLGGGPPHRKKKKKKRKNLPKIEKERNRTIFHSNGKGGNLSSQTKKERTTSRKGRSLCGGEKEEGPSLCFACSEKKMGKIPGKSSIISTFYIVRRKGKRNRFL